jgi:hypothetical protein
MYDNDLAVFETGTDDDHDDVDETSEKKKHKKRLKNAFRRQHQRIVLERRLRQAVDRGDTAMADDTARTLANMTWSDAEQAELDWLQHESASSVVLDMREDNFRFIREIYQRLPLQEYDHDESRNLLYHMSKASTEVVDLYCRTNLAALKGYTRQKFVERARLVADSIARVHFVASTSVPSPTSCSGKDADHVECNNNDDNNNKDETTTSGCCRYCHLFRNKCRTFSNQLQQVRSIASIGCGPGSDLTGAVAATVVTSRTKNDTTDHHGKNGQQHMIENIVALDSSMDDCWDMIVQDVLAQFRNNNIAPNDHIYMENCDIRIDPNNGASVGDNDASVSAAAASATAWSRSALDRVVACSSDGNLLICISYVLCETRGQWYEWMDRLVDECKVGTLFLLTDPTAWQLHIFRFRYRTMLDHVWLDTSMYRPDLQELETRNGPAVLLLRRTSESERNINDQLHL